MTYEEADRLVTIIHMNYAAFLPASPEASAVKKGMWCGELQKHDYKKGLTAVQNIIGTLQYPPTMYDLKQALGIGGDYKREDPGLISGPVFGTKDGNSAMYTADMDRVGKMLADLDKELAGIRFGRSKKE